MAYSKVKRGSKKKHVFFLKIQENEKNQSKRMFHYYNDYEKRL